MLCVLARFSETISQIVNLYYSPCTFTIVVISGPCYSIDYLEERWMENFIPNTYLLVYFSNVCCNGIE